MRLVKVVTRTRSPLATRSLDLGDGVIDLDADRAHLNLGVEEARGADDLLDDDAAGLLHLEVAGRGRDVDRLLDLA
jgi:hypothetical protein